MPVKDPNIISCPGNSMIIIRLFASAWKQNITLHNHIKVYLSNEWELTFPCHNLFTPQQNTFGNDIATVMMAIEGMHSYHILIENFLSENDEPNFDQSFVYDNIRKIFFSDKWHFHCPSGSTVQYYLPNFNASCQV